MIGASKYFFQEDDEDDDLSLDEEFEAFWKENGERLSGSDPFGE